MSQCFGDTLNVNLFILFIHLSLFHFQVRHITQFAWCSARHRVQNLTLRANFKRDLTETSMHARLPHRAPAPRARPECVDHVSPNLERRNRTSRRSVTVVTHVYHRHLVLHTDVILVKWFVCNGIKCHDPSRIHACMPCSCPMHWSHVYTTWMVCSFRHHRHHYLMEQPFFMSQLSIYSAVFIESNGLDKIRSLDTKHPESDVEPGKPNWFKSPLDQDTIDPISRPRPDPIPLHM